MLRSLIVGAMLTVVTVGVHAIGTTWLIAYLTRFGTAYHSLRPKLLRQLRLLCTTALLLLVLHIVEVAIWAVTYRILPIEGIDDLEEATYFSTVSITSLGYGDLVITNSWRILGAVQAMAGLLVFGWSTALLFAVVQRIWDPRHAQEK